MAMFESASLKLGLDRAVLHGVTNKRNGSTMSKDEMERLLKYGAYSVFDAVGENKDEEEDGFFNASIDEILQARTRAVNTLGGGDEDDLNSERDILSKATFASKENGESVEIDDPDFWKKVLGEDAVSKKEETLILDRTERRSRKRKVDYSEKSIWTNVMNREDDDDIFEDEEEEEEGNEYVHSRRRRGRSSKGGSGSTYSKIQKSKKTLRDDEVILKECKSMSRKIYMAPWKDWNYIGLMLNRAASYKSEFDYVNNSAERPVLIFSAALRMVAAAAEAFKGGELVKVPSVEDAFDAPKRMSKRFICLERFQKEKDQWRRDARQLTLMRSAIANVRHGISSALANQSGELRFSIDGVRREIERGLRFEETADDVAAWNVKEKLVLKQFLDDSELWELLIEANNRNLKKKSTTSSVVVPTSTSPSPAVRASSTSPPPAVVPSSVTTTTASPTTTTEENTTKNVNEAETKKQALTRKRGKRASSRAHARLRQLDTSIELSDMLQMCETETWKSIHEMIMKCPLKMPQDEMKWTKSDDIEMLKGIKLKGRFEKSMTKIWKHSFASRFKKTDISTGHRLLTKRCRDVVRIYRSWFTSKRNEENKKVKDEERRQNELIKQQEKAKREKLREEMRKKKKEEKLIEKKRNAEIRAKLREEKRIQREEINKQRKEEKKRRMQEKQEAANVFKRRKLLGKDQMSSLMRKWIGMFSLHRSLFDTHTHTHRAHSL